MIILDEPTIGLDPTQIVEIRNLIKRLAEHSTILFSSHILAEVEAVCDRVIMIIAGRVKADARLDELEATSNTILVLQQEIPDVTYQLSGIPYVTAVEPFQTREGYPAYRVVSEAMANVARHARATSCSVHLVHHDAALHVDVVDDGIGIPVDAQAGVGLIGLRERVSELGGTSEVVCPPGGGTAVRVRIPLRSEA